MTNYPRRRTGQSARSRRLEANELVADDSRAVLDETVQEKALQLAMVDMAHRLGYMCHHIYDSRLAAGGRRKDGTTPVTKGFPDWVLAHHGWRKGERSRVLVVELKKETEQPTTAQREWLTVLAAAGIEVHVWRPSDWSNGTIERVLMAGISEGAA